jgi:5-methylcytosine-specific restriction endonuclease McrA
MESLSRATRDKIASAAHYRCEYCQTAQEISGAQMHIEHIIPLSRGGRSDDSNLCLACAWCNSYKWRKVLTWLRRLNLEVTGREDVGEEGRGTVLR